MAIQRKALSKRVRFEVFKRDGFCCQYCGGHPPKVVLHVDHIVAVASGGGNGMDNLTTSCDCCNLGKSAIPLTDIPQSLKDKAAEVAEREAQLKGYHDVMQARYERLDEESWLIAKALCDDAYDGFSRDWRRGIKVFLERLSFHEVLNAADIARARKAFCADSTRLRYFCGICWRQIKGE